MGARADWFGCSNVPMHESLCQYTISADDSSSQHPCFAVGDILEDEN